MTGCGLLVDDSFQIQNDYPYSLFGMIYTGILKMVHQFNLQSLTCNHEVHENMTRHHFPDHPKNMMLLNHPIFNNKTAASHQNLKRESFYNM